MEGSLRSCEDKHFVLYKSHFLGTHEAYQPHKEPQWGSEIQANTAAPPTFVFPTCPVPLLAAAALCVLLCAVHGCPCHRPLPLGPPLHRNFDKVTASLIE